MRYRAAHAFPAGSAACSVSAATVPETSTALSSGRHSPSSRLTRLTAGPIAVKSSRSAAPILPHKISPRCRAAPNGSGGSPCCRRASSRCAMPTRAAETARRAASQAPRGDSSDDRKDRQHAVADEFQHFAAEGVDRAGDAVEPGVERRDDRRGRIALGQRGEAAQIGIEQRGLDGLADVAPQADPPAPAPRCAGRDRPRAPRSSVARAARAASGAAAKRAAWRSSSVSSERERARPDPAQRRAVRREPDRVFVYDAGRESSEPAPAASPCGLAARRKPFRREPKASITSPLSARQSQVRRAISGCGTARVREPPTSGRPSATRRAPTSASSRSAPGASPATSTSQESAEESCIERSWR